jgi:hypothetical protein
MREDEEKCKNAFDLFLRQFYENETTKWEDGDDPPDYVLQLKGRKYAVEVTSLLEKAIIGDKSIDHIEIDKSVMEFIDSIKVEATNKRVLQGAYSVSYKPIEKFGKNKQVIAARIWDYLLRTKYESSSPRECIFGEGHNEWYIQKYHSSRNYLSRTTTDAKWGGESVDELCNSLNKTLERKVKKLEAISLPKILLIHDRFAWIDAKNWIKYLGRINNIEKFHTIFLVSIKDGNLILYSIEGSWLNIRVDNS